jgi:RNA polymerase sigma factor (sigma-70 family)
MGSSYTGKVAELWTHRPDIFMESPTRTPFLDHTGNPLPDRIQSALDKLVPRLRKKFSMIRDEVILVEIMEQAGQKLLNREVRDGRIDQLYGFAWVTVYRVAISKLRSSPYLLEQPTVDSAESASALSRLTSEQSSPASIERDVLVSQVLGHLSPRERMIAIWKKSGFSSREIAENLEISVSTVDTTFCRVRQKVQRLLGPGPELD